MAILQCANYAEPQKMHAEQIDAYEGFGSTVATKNGVLAVGTRGEKTHIHIRDKENAVWAGSAVLREQNFQQAGLAKKSIALQDQNTLLVGNPNSGYIAKAAGAIRMYKLSDGVWTAQTIIAPADLEPYESFGTSIALDERLLAVGATGLDNSGAVYIYSYSAGQWKNPFRVVPEETTPNQEFGYSITTSGGRVAVGAPGEGVGKNGAVYIYTKSAGTWAVEKIVQQNQRLNARFGSTVLLYDNLLFVGAMRNDQGRETLNRGVVYVYEKQNNGWQMVQKLEPEEDDSSGEFGTAIARSGSMLAIGAPKSSLGRKRSGAVYLYQQTERKGPWSFKESITPTDLRNGDRFGAAITFNGLDLLIGAYGNDEQEKNIGAVYSYTGEATECTQETDTQEGEEVIERKTEQSQTDLLQALKEQRDVLSKVVANASSIVDQLGERIQGVYDGITKKEEGIVIYDEEKVLENAQRRAAERRGIIGPGLPSEVTTRRVDSVEKIPNPPTKETVRPREISYTRNKKYRGHCGTSFKQKLTPRRCG